jgi:hypothetical protein
LRQATQRGGKSGRPAIVSGQPEQSELIQRIFTEDEEEVMPPPHSKNPLSVEEKQTFRPFHHRAAGQRHAAWKSVYTDQFNHAPAQIFFNTGFAPPGRPSLGSWVLYGLGSMTRDLPAFVVLSTGGGISGGSANWSSGFLPTIYTGVRLRNQGDPILNVSGPSGVDPHLQRDSLELIGSLNRRRLETEGDPEIAARIASYEMAFRLQTSAPELMDLLA